jgi:hypothetical protein
MSAALVLAIIALAACNSTETQGNKTGAPSRGNATVSLPTTTPGSIAPSDGVKRITTIELRDLLAKNAAVVVDVRPADAYRQNHIKGSISIPLEQVQSRLNELPRDKMIVTYCS